MGDLDTLVTELYEARTKWYFVGLKLKVPADVLDTIESESDDLAEMFLRVLKTALKRVEPLLTWRAVVEALKSPTVGLQLLAKKIEAKYCPPAQAPETDFGTYSIKHKYRCTYTCAYHQCDCVKSLSCSAHERVHSAGTRAAAATTTASED